jgi:hypothetical protein
VHLPAWGGQMGRRRDAGDSAVPMSEHAQAHPLLRPETPPAPPPHTPKKPGCQDFAQRETFPGTQKSDLEVPRPGPSLGASMPAVAPTPPPAAHPPGLGDSLPQGLHVVEAVRAADVVDQHEGVCVLQAPVLRVRPLLGAEAGLWGMGVAVSPRPAPKVPCTVHSQTSLTPSSLRLQIVSEARQPPALLLAWPPSSSYCSSFPQSGHSRTYWVLCP